MLRSSCSSSIMLKQRGSRITCRGLKENVAQLPTQSPKLVRIEVPAVGLVVMDVEGKRASFAIYGYLAQRYGRLNQASAGEGLKLYAEITDEAKAQPGSHPSIDVLLNVVADSADYAMTVQEA